MTFSIGVGQWPSLCSKAATLEPSLFLKLQDPTLMTLSCHWRGGVSVVLTAPMGRGVVGMTVYGRMQNNLACLSPL
jgi:hypothetical protein